MSSHIIMRDRSPSDSVPRNIDQVKILHGYTEARSRLLIFDYDGTLTPLVADAAEAQLAEDQVQLINRLSQSRENIVWIISGRSRQFLEGIFGKCPSIGLASEHGAFVRRPHELHWRDLHLDKSCSERWRTAVQQHLSNLCQKVPGSFIEDKESAIVWHYRGVDSLMFDQFGSACIRKLEQERSKNRWECQITEGKCIIEIRPCGIHKGNVVGDVLQTYKSRYQRLPDFVLCAGDDLTDEDMFKTIKSSALPTSHTYCIKVGPFGSTEAAFTLDDPEDLFHVLSALDRSTSTDDGIRREHGTYVAYCGRRS